MLYGHNSIGKTTFRIMLNNLTFHSGFFSWKVRGEGNPRLFQIIPLF